jgi:hypothetical protein
MRPTLPAGLARASAPASHSIGLAAWYADCGMRGRNRARGGSGKSLRQADDRARGWEDDAPMNSTEIRARLAKLHFERIDAEELGLTENETYMADLEEEIFEWRAVLVLTAVTEAAVARAEETGRLFG